MNLIYVLILVEAFVLVQSFERFSLDGNDWVAINENQCNSNFIC